MSNSKINNTKWPVLGVMVDSVDYQEATRRILRAAKEKRSFTVSATAVHGLMTGVLDRVHRYRLNSFDLVVADGQPVRWWLNSRYRCGLTDRVYGPQLTLEVCREAASAGVPVFFYGSTEEVVTKMVESLGARFPDLRVAGIMPSLFRRTTPADRARIVRTLRESGAGIVFVGLGCPRQEVWIYEYASELDGALIGVGAAFDFHAGTIPQAPALMQQYGLEWLFRLVQEPGRLWKRYLYYNSLFLLYTGVEWLFPGRFSPLDGIVPEEYEHFG